MFSLKSLILRNCLSPLLQNSWNFSCEQMWLTVLKALNKHVSLKLNRQTSYWNIDARNKWISSCFIFSFLGHNSNHLSKLNFCTQHPFQVPQLCSCYKTCPNISHCLNYSKAARGYHCFPVLCGQQQQQLLHSLLHCKHHCCDCCSVIHTVRGYVNSSTRYGNSLIKALSLRSWTLHWE